MGVGFVVVECLLMNGGVCVIVVDIFLILLGLVFVGCCILW